MNELVMDWRRCQEEGWVPSLIALAAFNLDVLCIRYQLGFEVGRYAGPRG